MSQMEAHGMPSYNRCVLFSLTAVMVGGCVLVVTLCWVDLSIFLFRHVLSGDVGAGLEVALQGVDLTAQDVAERLDLGQLLRQRPRLLACNQKSNQRCCLCSIQGNASSKLRGQLGF